MAQENVIELKDVNIYHSVVAGRRLTRRNYRKRGEAALTGVNLTVGAGEMVYLIGRVGSGKSTLLKTMYAEVPLFEGEGRVAGYDLTRLRTKDIPHLRRKLGVVFQDYQLLGDRNVVENLRFVLRATGWKNTGDILHRIEEVLGQVGLVNKEHKMPFELSGGEQQRLSIARALLNKPEVILADEPTGNLDPEAADEIMRLFRTIAESGCAIVMSTHNIANIQQYISRTVRFNRGCIEELDINVIFGEQ
jgi:cell division transport system ATP-binding protein